MRMKLFGNVVIAFFAIVITASGCSMEQSNAYKEMANRSENHKILMVMLDGCTKDKAECLEFIQNYGESRGISERSILDVSGYINDYYTG